MTLIKCSECGKQISDLAKKCIHCGCPIDVINKKEEKTKTKVFYKKKKLIIGIIIFLFILIAISIIILTKNDKSYLGKWEHYVEWDRTDNTKRKSYAYVEFFTDGTFNYFGSDDTGSESTFNGTYVEKNKIIYIDFVSNNIPYTMPVFINNDKLCLEEKNCSNYYIKSTSNENKNLTMAEQAFITEEEYQNLLKEGKDAIIVLYMENCNHCKDYEKEIIELQYNTDIPIYYYNIRMENATLKNYGTPTTLFIKNNKIVYDISGKQEDYVINDKINEIYYYSYGNNENKYE